MGQKLNRLVLVRHGESEGNLVTSNERTRMTVGTNLYPLTERGRKQAEITAEWLNGEFGGTVDAVYSSYYERAMETARLVCDRMGLKAPYVDPRLAEAQRGMYHNLGHDEIAARYPEEHSRRDKEGLYHYRPWGGENWPDVELRLLSLMRDVTEDHANGDALLVGHGHTFLLLERLIEGFPPEEALRRYKLKDDRNGHGGVMDNAAVTAYEFDLSSSKSWNSTTKPWTKTLSNFVPWEGKV